ncbi:MAG: S46 family peptidase [Bacteroidales bacterium]|nr:S46 family peptidase [Bacteroidales bacterium]
MKKSIVAALILAFTMSVVPAKADEGMWIPALISQRIGDMQAKGFKLSAEDIYSINQASLKDAVILFGSGCTGEVVSGEGLLFTNHHCGYSMIQSHSSVEHDYLRDGFWAMNRSQELPCRGLTVSFLERMEDVTSAVLKGVSDDMTESERNEVVNKNMNAIKKEVTSPGNGLKARVEPLYYGNQYFLFLYRDYRDIRFVGAPPSSIGKFGGDTDNWMWPRHTGDFSIFRIYADKDNNPADYNEDNVPYQPKKFFKISRAGVKEGDFTFIYGFPGSTQEYIVSEAARYIGEVSDPHGIALRTKRLDVMNKYMSESQAVRIQYSAKYARVSNAWKKWQGEALGIKRMKAVENKLAYEKKFGEWSRETEFEGSADRIIALYKDFEKYDFARMYYNETAATIELPAFAARTLSLLSEPERVKGNARYFFKDYYLPIDKESFVLVMKSFDENMPEEFKPAFHKENMAAYGSVEAWAEDIFTNSIFADPERAASLTEADRDAILADPAYRFQKGYSEWMASDIQPEWLRYRSDINLAYRTFMRGRMHMAQDGDCYPEANLTLRVAYGHVKGYSPRDGVYYEPYSTLKGIMEKDNPEIFDYNIPQVLRDLYAAGDIPDTPVCFCATNHTTGGNSGSPVINADGNLVGINFDRVWEGTMSDIVFDPDYCRNIALDIRYLLFIVEKIGGATWLLDEMSFVDQAE